MKKSVLECFCLIMILLLPAQVATALDEATFELSKVTANIYAGKQSIPLYPLGLSPIPGPYLTVNLYLLASEDKSEVVLIDAPVLVPNPAGGAPLIDLLTPFLTTLNSEFPGATIKAVLLTHDHLDHISGSIMYFLGSAVPVYIGAEEVAANWNFKGEFDFPVELFFLNTLEPGDSIPFGTGQIKAVQLYGHTPGHLGYARTEENDGKINWLFAGDALHAPPEDYGGALDPYNITYCFRLQVLATDNPDIPAWIGNLETVAAQMTPKSRLFPAHGAIEAGVYWLSPAAYIDYTIGALQNPDFTSCQQ